MKKFFILTAALLLTAGTLHAKAQTVFKAVKASDWIPTPQKQLTVKNGVVTINGPTRLLSSKTITIDPAKEYTLTAEIRQTGGIPRQAYVGFSALDAKGKTISCARVAIKKGTETALTKAVKKGDKVIWIKPNKKWDPEYRVVTGFNVIVWNVKADLSDLPNENIFYCSVAKAETVGKEMKITLPRPFPAALPAGTTLRCHSDGGFLYTAGYGVPSRNDFKRYSGSIKGMSKFGYDSKIWPVGTKKCRIVILANWGGKADTKCEIRNVQLTAK